MSRRCFWNLCLQRRILFKFLIIKLSDEGSKFKYLLEYLSALYKLTQNSKQEPTLQDIFFYKRNRSNASRLLDFQLNLRPTQNRNIWNMIRLNSIRVSHCPVCKSLRYTKIGIRQCWYNLYIWWRKFTLHTGSYLIWFVSFFNTKLGIYPASIVTK